MRTPPVQDPPHKRRTIRNAGSEVSNQERNAGSEMSNQQAAEWKNIAAGAGAPLL
jgi:hypothetical protein